MEAVGHPPLTPSFVTPLTSEELHCFSPAEEKAAGITESMNTSGRVEVQLSLGTIQASDTSGVTPLPALMIYAAKLGVVLKCSCWSPRRIN